MEEINIGVKEEILILSKNNYSLSTEELKEIANTFNNKFNLILYKNSLGYYFGYDIKNNKDIYCGGTMSEKQAIKKIKEYGKNKN